MDSFISWIGGKKALRKKIVEQFPVEGTYNRYIEVFGGAGWVLFSTNRKVELEIYNDVDGNLVNLFRCVKYHSEALQKELEYILMSREQFFDAKEQIEIRGLTDIQRAARFYILIKESFASDLHSFGLRSRDMDRAKEYLNVVSKRLRMTVIENQDFQRVIKNYDRADALFYLDPPYFGTEKYYTNDFDLEEHIRLKESLDSIKGKFVLSYNNCEYIKELYENYTIIKVDRMHNLIQKEKKPHYQELIIKNFL